MEAKSLTPVGELIKNSFRIYFKKENLIYLTKVVLVSFVIMLVLGIPIMALGIGLKDASLGSNPYIITTLAAIIGVGAVVLGLWVQTTTIYAVSQVVKGETVGIKKTFALAWQKVGKYFLVSLLTGLAVALGIILLVIPGIIFAVWFAFARFIAVAEEKDAISSIKRSKELVKGYFWAVVGRSLVFALLIIVIQVGLSLLLPFFGTIIVMFLNPFFLLLPYLLYQDLKRVKG